MSRASHRVEFFGVCSRTDSGLRTFGHGSCGDVVGGLFLKRQTSKSGLLDFNQQIPGSQDENRVNQKPSSILKDCRGVLGICPD